ncbi:hypothetical protein ACLOJK_024764 [Asimina triloba]
MVTQQVMAKVAAVEATVRPKCVSIHWRLKAVKEEQRKFKDKLQALEKASSNLNSMHEASNLSFYTQMTSNLSFYIQSGYRKELDDVTFAYSSLNLKDLYIKVKDEVAFLSFNLSVRD